MKRSIMCITAMVVALCFLIPANIIAPQAKAAFYPTATTLAIKNHIEYDAGFNKYCTAQGSCTDGKYAYFAVNNGSTAILKYNVSTWSLVKRKTGVDLGHANDMTYNSDEDIIVVANNAPDYDTVSFLDPDTLKVTGYKKLKIKIHSISYNPKRKCYAVGISGTYDFAILDSSFKLVEKFKGYKSGYIRQGGDCDDDYLYFVQSGGGGNIIVIYDWEGTLVDTVSVDKSLEIENIFHVGNTFYITLHYYGNYVYRIGINDKTAIKFKVHYDGDGASSQMEDTTVMYGKGKKLSKCTFERDGYFFGGWKIKREAPGLWFGKKSATSKSEWLSSDDIDEYTLYKDETTVSKTTKVGDITAQAFWISNEYRVYYSANGGDGFIPSRSVRHDEVFALDKNTLTKKGFIFTGWTATRDVDNKVYAYPKGSKKPMWIHKNEMEKEYVFADCQNVSKMTYDKGVTFSARWQSAFTFRDNGTVLEKYIGNDADVSFPKNAKRVSTIGDFAFENCINMKTLSIPSSITTVGEAPFKGCCNLEEIHFDTNIPMYTKDSSFAIETTPKCYLNVDGKDIFIGWCIDKNSFGAMKGIAISAFNSYK